MNAEESGKAFLTADDVRRWKDERARLEERLQQIVRKIEAAELLFPGMGSVQPESSSPARRLRQRSGNSIGDAVKTAIREAGVSLAPPDIRKNLEENGFAEQLSKNPNYLYTVIFRLTRRGDIVRDGDRYRLPSGDDSPDEDAGAEVPRLFTFQRSVEAVDATRKVGGT